MHIHTVGVLELYLHAVSCGTPEADKIVHYSSYNSTLEGSIVTFWCSDLRISSTSVCHKNASWVPDPISRCAALKSGTCMHMNKLSINCGTFIVTY